MCGAAYEISQASFAQSAGPQPFVTSKTTLYASATDKGQHSEQQMQAVLELYIELRWCQGHFPEAEKDPVIQIASLVTVQGQAQPAVKNIMTLDQCAPIVGAEVMSFRTEQQLLKVPTQPACVSHQIMFWRHANAPKTLMLHACTDQSHALSTARLDVNSMIRCQLQSAISIAC